MSDREVHTIRDLIFYQYAKIIARSAFKVADGEQAKKLHYGFIKNTFRDIKSGGKSLCVSAVKLSCLQSKSG